MKEVRYEDYLRVARAQFGRVRASVENRFSGRTVRQRPRDPSKEALLTAMDKRRWQEAIKTGKIKPLGRRTVQLLLPGP